VHAEVISIYTMSQKESDYTFKVVLVGDPTVGKTSIILRFIDNNFIPDNVTTNGVNTKTRAIQFGKKTVKLIIADTAGQERFRTISRSMYREADAVIVVYDQTVEKTYSSIKFWINEVDKYANENTRKFIVANKTDLPNVAVPSATGKGYAGSLDLQFFEVSAKADTNIDSLFQHLVHSVGERVNPNEDWGKFKISKPGSSSSGTTAAAAPRKPRPDKPICTIL